MLIVWKLGRLGRSLPHLRSAGGELKDRGRRLSLAHRAHDTTSPQGEPLVAVFGALARCERASIRERVMAGLRAAEARGRRGGRPRAISVETLAAIRAALERADAEGGRLPDLRSNEDDADRGADGRGEPRGRPVAPESHLRGLCPSAARRRSDAGRGRGFAVVWHTPSE